MEAGYAQERRSSAEQIIMKLRGAEVLIEMWGKHCNTARSHSSLVY